MAKITYGDELPDDSVGKKFQGAVYDTGSANAIAAVKGVNPVTQQGKTVVDQSVAVSTASGAGAAGGLAADAAVTTDATGTRSAYLRGIVAWFARLGSLDGAAFTAGSSYVWPGLAGVYQSTVGVLTAGKTGLARLTARRAVVTTGGDPSYVAFSSTTTADDLGFALTAADFDIRNTSPHYYNVGVGSKGDTSVSLFIKSTLDATLNIVIYGKFASGSVNRTLYTESAIIPATTGEVQFVPYTAATNAGTTVVVPAFAGNPIPQNLYVVLVAGSSPTTGTVTIHIERQ